MQLCETSKISINVETCNIESQRDLEQCSRMKPLVFIIILYVCFMDIVCNNKFYLVETRDKHNISSKENNLENISEKDYSGSSFISKIFFNLILR